MNKKIEQIHVDYDSDYGNGSIGLSFGDDHDAIYSVNHEAWQHVSPKRLREMTGDELAAVVGFCIKAVMKP